MNRELIPVFKPLIEDDELTASKISSSIERAVSIEN
jgi:hypothetical protein